MTPRDLLGVLVRFAGLALILLGLFDVYYIVTFSLGIQDTPQTTLPRAIRGFLAYSAMGIVILVGAEWIVRLAYWRRNAD